MTRSKLWICILHRTLCAKLTIRRKYFQYIKLKYYYVAHINHAFKSTTITITKDIKLDRKTVQKNNFLKRKLYVKKDCMFLVDRK